MAYFIFLFIVYVFTLNPSVSSYRDSGDLISAAFTLGVAHPSGYPLYALLGKIFTSAVPLGNIAYRVNVMSAFFGAAAVSILARAFRGPGKLAFLALGFTLPFWRLSLVSEMYTLNAFFIAVMALALAGEVTAARITGASFLAGIACGNHLTSMLALPGLAAAAYIARARRVKAAFSPAAGSPLSPKNVAAYILFFLLGCSVYAYLPARASAGAEINWGDPSTVEKFARVVTRADYGGLKLHPEESRFVWSVPSAARQLHFYSALLAERFPAPMIFFALVGAASVFAANIPAVFALAGFLFAGPLFSLLANLPVAKASTRGILEPHFLMPDVCFAILACIGANFFVSRPSAGRSSFFAALRRASVPAALALSAVYSFVVSAPFCFYRREFRPYDYAANVLATAPPGAVIYDPDDITAFSTDYLQYVSGRRPDVKKAVYFRTRWGYERMKKKSPEILPPREIFSGRELAREIVEYNSGKRAVLSELPSKFPPGVVSRPVGIMHETAPAVAARSTPPERLFDFYSMRGIPSSDAPPDFFAAHIVSYYASAFSNIGLYHFSDGNSEKARKFYIAALGVSGDLAAAWNNLGTLEYGRGRYADAAFFFEEAAILEPDNPASRVNAGLAYRRLGEREKARSVFEDILEKSYVPAAANELGLMQYEQGNYAAAESVFSEIIGRRPDFADAYYNLALVLSRSRPSEARRYFDAYEKLSK